MEFWKAEKDLIKLKKEKLIDEKLTLQDYV